MTYLFNAAVTGAGRIASVQVMVRVTRQSGESPLQFTLQQDNGTVIITADEGADDSGCCGDAAGGQVPMVVISANAEGRGDISLNGNHFGSLRTIEEAFGLPLLGAASDVANGDLGQLFG